MENFGFEFNVSLTTNEEGRVSVGYNYHDSDGVAFNNEAYGEDIFSTLELLEDSVFFEYSEAKKKLEEENMSEEDKLRKEIEKLVEENARLEHRIQEMMKGKEEKISEKRPKNQLNEEALAILEELNQWFGGGKSNSL